MIFGVPKKGTCQNTLHHITMHIHQAQDQPRADNSCDKIQISSSIFQSFFCSRAGRATWLNKTDPHVEKHPYATRPSSCYCFPKGSRYPNNGDAGYPKAQHWDICTFGEPLEPVRCPYRPILNPEAQSESYLRHPIVQPSSRGRAPAAFGRCRASSGWLPVTWRDWQGLG